MARPRRRPKPIVGFSADICWYVPNRKRPIATSTVTTKDTLKYFAECGYDTPNKMLQAIRAGTFIGGQEEKLIIQVYIDEGFGDMKMQIN